MSQDVRGSGDYRRDDQHSYDSIDKKSELDELLYGSAFGRISRPEPAAPILPSLGSYADSDGDSVTYLTATTSNLDTSRTRGSAWTVTPEHARRASEASATMQDYTPSQLHDSVNHLPNNSSSRWGHRALRPTGQDSQSRLWDIDQSLTLAPPPTSRALVIDSKHDVTPPTPGPKPRSKPKLPKPGETQFLHEFEKLFHAEPNQPVDYTLQINDTIGSFITKELDPEDSIWDLVVLTGDPLAQSNLLHNKHYEGGAWATTCGVYVATMWPRSVQQIQDMFGVITKMADTLPVFMQLPSSTNGDTSISIQEEVYPKEDRKARLYIKFHGLVEILADLLESLTWLYAVLQLDCAGDERGPPLDSQVSWSRLSSKRRGTGSTTCKLHCDKLGPLTIPSSSSCWSTLLPRTPCASQFCTPERPFEMEGLEMSFELMCFLGGLQYEGFDDHGVFLFGRSTTAYPIRESAGCVQWHFEISDFQQSSSLPFAVQQRLGVSSLDSIGHGKRHFVGLWKQAGITLGSEESDLSKIAFSSADEVKSELMRDGFEFSGTVQAPRVLQITWTEQFKVARSRKNQYMTDFVADLHRMIGVPVLLYSPEEKRAWLISYVSLLLHLSRARALLQEGLGYHIPACRIGGDGGTEAFECLKGCHRDPLKRPARNEVLSADEQSFTIRAYVEDVKASLVLAQRETSRAKRLFTPFRQSMVGYELADITRMKPVLHMKQHSLDRSASGCWGPLLDEVQYLFFVEGLDDPILPASDTNPSEGCATWNRIPQGHNLLSASLPVLAHMSEPWNHEFLERLTLKHRWHTQDKIFAPCQRSDQHSCSRLQELRSRASSPAVRITMREAKEGGAVVFRYKDGFNIIQAALVEHVPVLPVAGDAHATSSIVAQDSTESVTSTRPVVQEDDSGYSSIGQGQSHPNRPESQISSVVPRAVQVTDPPTAAHAAPRRKKAKPRKSSNTGDRSQISLRKPPTQASDLESNLYKARKDKKKNRKTSEIAVEDVNIEDVDRNRDEDVSEKSKSHVRDRRKEVRRRSKGSAADWWAPWRR